MLFFPFPLPNFSPKEVFFPMIAILDYGMGNLRSVQKALEFLAVPCFITEIGRASCRERV